MEEDEEQVKAGMVDVMRCMWWGRLVQYRQDHLSLLQR
jgi:hypothetical protein